MTLTILFLAQHFIVCNVFHIYDTFFPLFDEEIWHEVSRQEPEQQGETPYFFQILEKI